VEQVSNIMNWHVFDQIQQISCQTVIRIVCFLVAVLYWYTVLFVENTDSSFFKHRIDCILLMKLEKNATDIFMILCKFVGKQVITSNDRSVCLGSAGE